MNPFVIGGLELCEFWIAWILMVLFWSVPLFGIIYEGVRITE
jgi:hypothetical protein